MDDIWKVGVTKFSFPNFVILGLEKTLELEVLAFGENFKLLLFNKLGIVRKMLKCCSVSYRL